MKTTYQKTDLIKKDLDSLWHPCAQMKDYENFKPIEIDRAIGPYIYTKDNKEIIDAISSWWCKSLGHGHPNIHKSVIKQMGKFEHTILANTTNETIAELAHKMTAIDDSFSKIFFTDSGSDAVEVAIKMSLQYFK